jgi:DNA-binding winged helix-turn-helix (wHTH) protein
MPPNDLLKYIFRNRDRVASKDDLIQAVWGGVVRPSDGETGIAL